MKSETSKSKDILAPYCTGIGMDVGYGGEKVVPTAWAFDLPNPYTCVGEERQQLRGDCRKFPFLCDYALDYIYSSHVLEDFTYGELEDIIAEWRRVLKLGGLLITNCPDQKKFLEHCQKTGQGINEAHKEPNFSLENFKYRVINRCGDWEVVYEQDNFDDYSWLQVLRKK